MSKPNRRPPLGLVIALVLAATMALAREPRAQGPDGQIGAIRALLDRQSADWNRGDLDAFLEGYWQSPRLVFFSGGDRHDGFDALRDRYRKRYQAEGKAMGELSFSGIEIDILGAGHEAAYARGRWQLVLPDGQKPGGLFTLILRKFPEGWKIVHDHTSIAEPPKPPAPG
jgi:ketosteroid isomerase-like protein